MRVAFVCPSAPHPVGGVVAMYEFANGLVRRGHEVHLLHGDIFGNHIDSIADLAWFRFEDGIHQHLVGAGGERGLPDFDIFFGTGAGERLGLPVMLVQGFDMFYRAVEREAFRTPCLKICVATWLIEVGVRFGAPREQFRYVPMGIDHERFQPSSTIGARPTRVAVLYSAHPAKGWPVAQEALELARRQRPDLDVVAFGTAEPPASLPPWLTFVAHPEPDVLVRDIYNGSSIFVQASEHEGFGFTAVEALACDCALVRTDTGGSADYALEGETGRRAEPGDAAGLAARIVELVDDPGTRIALAERGEQFVRRFDWDRGAELMEADLLEYLGDPDRFQAPPGPDLHEPHVAAEHLAAQHLRRPR